MATDTELISRVLLDDDRHAFSELIRRYQSPVRVLLRKLTAGDRAQADDLAQETFIRAHRHLPKFQGQAAFSTWLYRIAYNVFLSSVNQAQSRQPDREPEVDDLIDEKETPATERALLRIDLEKAMHCLSGPERTAVALSFGKGLPHEEIARVMACPVGTVKTHILRAREKLRAVLESFYHKESV